MSDASETIARRWARHAREHPEREAVVVWFAESQPFRWTWKALIDRACAHALDLERAGVAGGDVCAICIRHHRDFYPLYLAIELLGAIPAVLAYPNARLHPDKFRDGLRGMSRHSGLDWFLTESELQPMVADLVGVEGSTIRGLHFPLDRDIAAASQQTLERWLACHDDAEQPCLLQHSSGTTGLQKGVMLSHRAVLGHVDRYARAIGMTKSDRIVSWLPLYHDMGLIAAFHMPLASAVPTVQIDPFEWVSMPSLLLDAIHRERGTMAWLPNFAYSFMADRIKDADLEGVRLDSLRLVVNCSEPVREESHRRFIARFATLGMSERALATCYAMAETTFAVTQSTVGTAPRTRVIARARLAQGEAVAPQPGDVASTLVSSGTVIDDCAVRVVSESGDPLPAGRVGEIMIRSASLFSGYRNNSAKTAEVLNDGWLRSGDLGFFDDDGANLYVVGRKKDLIIIAGKNIYPEDVEDAVGQVPGIIPGRVVAFAADDVTAGTEMACVVAETEKPEGEYKALRLALLSAAMRIDVTIGRVYLVPPRWLIKSSAGKPSRSANRERALETLTPAT